MSLKGFEVFNVQKSAVQAIGVNALATAYSDIVTLGKHEYFGVAYQSSSGGTIALKLEIQNSIDGTNFVTPDDVTSIDSNIDDSNLHIKRLSVDRTPYIRFKITGLAGNAATTTINIYLIA